MNLEDIKETKEILDIVQEVKNIDEQLNSDKPQREKLIEITLKAKQKFLIEVCAQEEKIKLNQPVITECTIFQLTTNEILQRLPYYRNLYLYDLIKKYGQSVAEEILKEHNIL